MQSFLKLTRLLAVRPYRSHIKHKVFCHLFVLPLRAARHPSVTFSHLAMATVEEVTTQPSNFVDACEKGRLDDVRRMLHDRCDPNTRSSNRLFVLHLAANSGHIDVARLLLDLSATVDARDSADFTPMHYAAYHGHENVIDLLLERRADADAVGSNGSSPLHLASAGDHKTIAEKLIARGVDAGRRNVR